MLYISLFNKKILLNYKITYNKRVINIKLLNNTTLKQIIGGVKPFNNSNCRCILSDSEKFYLQENGYFVQTISHNTTQITVPTGIANIEGTSIIKDSSGKIISISEICCILKQMS